VAGNNESNTGGGNNGNSSFAPETEEEKALRLARLGKLFTIVGDGVRQ
jgi:hypothetical protein